MNTEKFHLTFLTPCFCAGAVPGVAEVRAPSIRGKLRWWFRALGGSYEQEAQVFGSVAGDQGSASALVVRVDDVDVQRQWQPLNLPATSNAGYLLYFAKASRDGARWKPGGAIPEGASFELQLIRRRTIPDDAARVFDLALDAFLRIGALGLRSTRGLGSFETTERPLSDSAFQSLKEKIERQNFIAGFGDFRGSQAQIIDALGAQLRGLRKGYSAGTPRRSNPSPLGSSQPRQASAVHLRPVKLGPNQFRIVVFEDPAAKVLDPDSRRGAPRLGAGIPSPVDSPQHRGRR